MRIETRPIWIADDGTVFDSMKACADYESISPAVKWLDADESLYWRDICAEEVVTSLLKKFDIIERK